MAFGGNILLAAASSSSTGDLSITISSNTQDYNVLTAATALGYNNSAGEDITITLIIDQGIDVTSTDTAYPALRTGVLNANTTLAITNNGNIEGEEGDGPSGSGGNGGTGGDGLFFETLTGGSATHSIINSTTGIISGGGGGGGGDGVRETFIDDGEGGYCSGPSYAGSPGAPGSVGQPGANGSYGAGSALCNVTAPGSGGAAGNALVRGGATIAVTNNGTINGSWT